MNGTRIASYARRRFYGGKVSDLSLGYDPDADHACFLALLFGRWVGGTRHGRVRTDCHGDFDGIRTGRRAFAHDAVTLHRPEVAVRAPVGEEIFHFVAGLGLPELVGLRGITRDHCVEEIRHGSFFWVKAKRPPERDNGNQHERCNREGQWPGFVRCYRRRIEK